MSREAPLSPSLAIAAAFVIVSTIIGPWIGSAIYWWGLMAGTTGFAFVYGFGALPSLVGSMWFMYWLRRNPRHSKWEVTIRGARYGMFGTLALGAPLSFLMAISSSSLSSFPAAFLTGLAFSGFVGLHGALAGAVLALALALLLKRRTTEEAS